jgi:hypothetical protein
MSYIQSFKGSNLYKTFSPYRAVKTPRLGYKIQSVDDV